MWIQFVLALEISIDCVKILQFTDLHYGEGDWQDEKNSNLQKKLIEWEQPDLAVLTGDLVSGYSWPGSLGWYMKYYKKYIQPMKDYKLPWAIALGNHDIEADLTGLEIMDIDNKEPLSLSKTIFRGLNHASNYYVPITHNGKIFFIIWILDTGNRNHLEFGFDRIHEDQLDWIKYTQNALNQASGYEIPGMMFMHIPPPEYMDIWDGSLGNKYADVSCPGNHTRYVMKSLKNIIAVSVGHDHYNDYQGKMLNISMFYGRKTGYAGVGPEPQFDKGGRVFVYNFTDRSLVSWIRDENGNKIVHTNRQGLFNFQYICDESIPQSYLVYIYPPILVIIAAFGLFVGKQKFA
jgi:Calcineurin-like phosphoesterase